MDEQLDKYQQKMFREIEKELTTGKQSGLLSPLCLSVVTPIFYKVIRKSYKKGFKRGKTTVIEVVSNIKL